MSTLITKPFVAETHVIENTLTVDLLYPGGWLPYEFPFKLGTKQGHEWALWLPEKKGCLQAVIDLEDADPQEGETDQAWDYPQLRSALAARGVKTDRTIFRIWFQRKTRGQWEPYWYAPR